MSIEIVGNAASEMRKAIEGKKSGIGPEESKSNNDEMKKMYDDVIVQIKKADLEAARQITNRMKQMSPTNIEIPKLETQIKSLEDKEAEEEQKQEQLTILFYLGRQQAIDDLPRAKETLAKIKRIDPTFDTNRLERDILFEEKQLADKKLWERNDRWDRIKDYYIRFI